MFQECRHIMPSGLRCHSPALRDEFFCYYHSSLQRSTAPKGKFDDQSLQFPRSRIQAPSRLRSPRSSVRSAPPNSIRAAPDSCSTAFRSQPRSPRALPFSSRPTPCASICHEGDGQVLAPENTVCEPPADCPDCLKRDTCINPLRPFDEFDEVLLEQEEEMMRMTEPL
jgi:hypothetical protein